MAILQHFAAGEGPAFFLQHISQVLSAQGAPLGQGAGGHMADPGFTQAAAGMGELLEHLPIEGAAAGLGDRLQQVMDFLFPGQGKVEQGE